MTRRRAPVSLPGIPVLSEPTEAATAATLQEPCVDHPSVEFSSFDQVSRVAPTPLTRFNELSVHAIEHAARYSYEAAGDSLRLILAHVHSVSQATDPMTLLQRSASFAHAFAALHVQRSGELAQLASESRAGFTRWLVETTAELATAALRIPMLVAA
jgi:hypothetical protein